MGGGKFIARGWSARYYLLDFSIEGCTDVFQTFELACGLFLAG